MSCGSAPGGRKIRRDIIASARGLGENSSLIDDGCRKSTAEKNAVSTPTSEPNVPGAFGMYPTPSAVASAIANRGLSLGFPSFAFNLPSGVIALRQIQYHCLATSLFQLVLIENRRAHHI